MRIPLFTCLIVLCFAAAVRGEENLLVDASFEGAASGNQLPAGWGSWQPEGSKYTAAVVGEAHTGSRAVLLEGDGKFMTFNTVDYPINPGDCYLFGGWVRLEDEAAEGSVKLDLTDKGGNWIGDTGGNYFKPGEAGWRSIIMITSFEDVPAAAQFRLVFTLGGKGKLWLDDTYLEKISPPARNGLLVNGDMELTAREAVVGWQVNHDSAAEASSSPGHDGVHGGKAALQIRGKGTWASANSLRVAARDDQRHTATAWVKVGDGNARLQFSYWNGGQYLGATDTERATAGEWQQLTLEADMKKYETITHLSLAIICEGPKIDVLIDDTEILEAGPMEK